MMALPLTEGILLLFLSDDLGVQDCLVLYKLYKNLLSGVTRFYVHQFNYLPSAR